MFGNRGIYHQGWSAVTKHKTPWLMLGDTPPAFDDDIWELYDGTKDWSQTDDLSALMPDKLRELQRLWLIEAVKYNVLPLDDRLAERFDQQQAGRPTLIQGNKQVLFGGMKRLSEFSVVSIKNKSFSLTADIETKRAPASGVIIAQGGTFGGWSMYTKDGLLKFVYNVLGLHEWIVASDSAIPTGKHQVRMEFAYDGGGLAKGGNVTLYCDGEAIGTGRVDLTQPMVFSADETTDIGSDLAMPVSADYRGNDKFNGKIHVVQIDLGDDDHSHLVDLDEMVRVAMARQ
jgi:arylsulfatase